MGIERRKHIGYGFLHKRVDVYLVDILLPDEPENGAQFLLFRTQLDVSHVFADEYSPQCLWPESSGEEPYRYFSFIHWNMDHLDTCLLKKLKAIGNPVQF